MPSHYGHSKKAKKVTKKKVVKPATIRRRKTKK